MSPHPTQQLLPEKGSNSKFHLWVVDDEASFRLLLRRIFTRPGFEVTEAASGEQAIRMMGSGLNCDAILLDYRMPGLNGGETLVQLQKNGFRGIALLLTAAAEFQEISERYGFDEVVQKPCSMAAIEQALELARTRRGI